MILYHFYVTNKEIYSFPVFPGCGILYFIASGFSRAIPLNFLFSPLPDTEKTSSFPFHLFAGQKIIPRRIRGR